MAHLRRPWRAILFEIKYHTILPRWAILVECKNN
jgi:hypothetical protein